MPSRTLLRHTLTRIESVLDVIDTVDHTDFPHDDSRVALHVVRKEFTDIHDLLRSQPEKSDPAAISTACKRALDHIFAYLPLIGIIARSSGIESAPELHGPLRRLTLSIIGPSARLLVSSEWDYSPYTTFYPPLTQLQFVVLGLPRSEAANALAAPLAGHELGHNVWSQQVLAEHFRADAMNEIRRTIADNWKQFSDATGLTDQSQLDDLIGQTHLSQPYKSCMAQAEEIFCDLIGLFLFGESFLLAFQYLLSPGLVRGDLSDEYCEYPRIKDRVAVLEKFATGAGIRLPGAFSQTFVLDESQQPWPRVIADAPALALVPKLAAKAQQVLGYGSTTKHDLAEIERHANRFRRNFPAIGASSIAHLINAAWRVYEEPAFVDRFKGSDRQLLKVRTALNELLLKSIEVFEIEQRQKPS